MANRRRTSNVRYESYGSAAYAPVYEGNAVRAPHREEEYSPLPQPRRREQVRRRQITRTQVQVRPAGAVAPFAVVGFLAVAVLAALLLFSYAQCAVVSDQVVQLRGELSTLRSENIKLTAQYEQVFDMDKIQSAVGDSMARPSSGQAVYLDLSEPDAVVIFDRAGESAIGGALARLGQRIGETIEYFR